MAPAGTPKDIVHKLSADIGRALNDPQVKQRLFEVGAEAAPGTPEAFGEDAAHRDRQVDEGGAHRQHPGGLMHEHRHAGTTVAARLLSRRDGAVLVLTLSNPAARNAMHPSLYRTAVALLREVANDQDRARHRADRRGRSLLRRWRPQAAGRTSANCRARAGRHLDALHDWVMAMHDAPQPVIAAVEGAAAGGGFSVCLGCDLIVAAQDAKFVMSYVRLALSPDGGGSDSLARALPPQAALELLLEGGVCRRSRLQGWGVVNRVVPHGEAFATALAWARQLAAGPFDAQARIKQLVHAARGRSRRAQLDAERDAFVESLYSDECGAGLEAFLSARGRART
jgi:enoyl-CoA hydratase/carnithine racemase